MTTESIVAYASPTGTSVVYRTWIARALKIRALKRFHPEVNYINGWKDVQGWGLLWAHADWVRPGDVHIAL